MRIQDIGLEDIKSDGNHGKSLKGLLDGATNCFDKTQQDVNRRYFVVTLTRHLGKLFNRA